jgi:hypothetical protein
VFFGQDSKPEPTLVDKSPQKSFSVVIDGGEPEFINCDYVNFHAAHVSFWQRTPDADKQDTLVLSLNNKWVDELKEVDFQ